MANVFQKLIYNLSAVVPINIIFALTWYRQNKTLTLPLISLGIALFLILIFYLSFSYGKKHTAILTIRANSISPVDNWGFAYVISYLLPLASIVIESFDVLICAVIGGVLIFLLFAINTASPNPLLFLSRYHFYNVSAENGVSGYILISKRDLRNTKDLKTVQRVFEFLLLDTKNQ